MKYSRLNRAFPLITLLMVIALFLVACGGITNSGGSSSPSPAPQQQPNKKTSGISTDFQISVYRGEEVLGGNEILFSEVLGKGKPVVLNFWAGLCPPCRAEMPDIQSVSDVFGEEVIIFGLDIGPFVGLDSREEGQALLEELEITYPTGTTFDAEVVQEYQILGMPTTVFFTADGRIRNGQPAWTSSRVAYFAIDGDFRGLGDS